MMFDNIPKYQFVTKRPNDKKCDCYVVEEIHNGPNGYIRKIDLWEARYRITFDVLSEYYNDEGVEDLNDTPFILWLTNNIEVRKKERCAER